MGAIEKVTVSYDTDVYAWAQEQARLIRAGHLDQIDIENVAEEIESVGRSELREALSYVEKILLHLTCLKFSPARQPRKHWKKESRNFRDLLEASLRDSPSLKRKIEEQFDLPWRRARRDALEKLEEDGIMHVPAESPFILDQVLHEDYFPEIDC